MADADVAVGVEHAAVVEDAVRQQQFFDHGARHRACGGRHRLRGRGWKPPQQRRHGGICQTDHVLPGYGIAE
jgi:hypothetical protein